MNVVVKVLFGLIGGSVDFVSLNKVYMKDFFDFFVEIFEGCNIWYGICEYVMVGIFNGFVFYNLGLIFIVVIFLIFSDYMKNLMCLFVLSEVGVIYILIYDLIGLGEDGLIY